MIDKTQTDNTPHWSRKRVPNGYERCSCACCWGCCYRIFDPLRLCRFPADRNETSHILMTIFWIKLPWRIFDLGSN